MGTLPNGAKTDQRLYIHIVAIQKPWGSGCVLHHCHCFASSDLKLAVNTSTQESVMDILRRH